MFEERVCLPEENVSFRPLKIQTPVPSELLPYSAALQYN
jgi:hypothetical protein